ncbi:MAG: IclR family transcriptional regulator [Proteobacteria bacterium]|nr:IclR family transcriptional regulator [Pseudomonadota bacterium]
MTDASSGTAPRSTRGRARASGKPKSDYSIQTVTNALRLLEAFRHDDELGVAELSRRLELHKNNVFRLLATLEQAGYIEQNGKTDRYRLGVRCLELGQAYARGRDLVRTAGPILEGLVEQLGETAHLAVLEDFDVAHLAGAQPKQLVVTALRVGGRLPAYCTALGKVLLACSEPAVREVYDRSRVSAGALLPRVDATIVDRHKFFEHLSSVAVQGYALDLEECAVGLHCVAAPVHDDSGGLECAISVSGPAFRLTHDRLVRDVVPVITDAADRLSRSLSGSL